MQTLTPDTIIHDRYVIVRSIGQGGMGAVYEAFDQRLDNYVALKQMVVHGTRLREAFEREAKLLAKLRRSCCSAHAGLVSVFDLLCVLRASA